MYYSNTQPIQRWTGAGSCCSTTVLNVCGLHTQKVVLLAACYLACAISYLLLIVLQEKKTISLLWTCPMRATLTMQLHWNWVGHTSFPIFFLHSTLLVCHRAPAFFFFPSPSGQNPRLYTAFIQKLPDHFNIPFFSSLYSPSSKTYLQNRANRDAMNSKYLGFFSWPLFALFDRL